jgi:hypothetical protein
MATLINEVMCLCNRRVTVTDAEACAGIFL